MYLCLFENLCFTHSLQTNPLGTTTTTIMNMFIIIKHTIIIIIIIIIINIFILIMFISGPELRRGPHEGRKSRTRDLCEEFARLARD